MAVLFLVLALLAAVVIGAAGFENTTASSATLLDRSFDQLTEGQLLVLFAVLGFLTAVFLFLAFGASRTRRSRRKELKSRRRDAEGRVGELERENDRLRQELESVERGRSDAVAERDRAEATADSIRSNTATNRDRAATATAVDDHPQADRPQAAEPAVVPPPEPISARRERLDDRTETNPPVREEHARAADEHAQAAEEHARAADDQAGRR
jgi:cell division protein FtsB